MRLVQRIGMAAGIAAAVAAAVAAVFLAGGEHSPGIDPIVTAGIPPVAEIRPAGEYLRDGRAVDAPLATVALTPGIGMMRFPVSRPDYMRCVDAGACAAPDLPSGADPRAPYPVTGVNFRDAGDYAAWLSRRTGSHWRLPTDAEWAAAAAERLAGDVAGLLPEDGDNPAERWLQRYRLEAARGRDPEPKPIGHFGANSNGFVDMGGNVWEWTSTCFTRTTLGPDGEILHRTENCGVRVVGGSHRAYMSHFLRDGRSGGCAFGLPPDNLGFRLVRETGPR